MANNSIGAYSQGATNSIGAYQFPLGQSYNNTIGAYSGGILAPTIGAYNNFTFDATPEFIEIPGGTISVAKITAAGEASFKIDFDLDPVLFLKPTCLGTARLIIPAVAPTLPVEDEDNGSLLQYNTNIRVGAELIRSGASTPIMDVNNIRYLIDVDSYARSGSLIWTRFSLTTFQPLDAHSFTRRYASHNTFRDLFSGLGSVGTIPLQTSTFPDFAVPVTNGVVSP